MVSDNDSGSRVRLRRTNSITVANAYREEKKQRFFQPDRPCHECRDALFSSSSKFQNYRGFLNLAFILLALSTGRVALENIIKYGILVDPMQMIKIFFSNSSIWPTIFTLFFTNTFIYYAFYIEKKLMQTEIKEAKALKLQIINCSVILLVPILMIFAIDIHPISSSLACFMYCVVFLKLISYHMVNKWCREAIKRGYKKHKRTRSIDFTRAQNNNNNNNYYNDNNNSKMNGHAPQALVQYPENLTLRDLYYFMFAPTLCYELNFPRSERIRKRFLIKRLLEMIFLVQLNLALMQQWMVPTINNSLKPLQEMDYSRMLERLLKLALPNHLIWLIWFYWYFHSTLNFVAEILRFGDKQFYRDWWNSESVEYFWKNWNIPVHNWCVRHLYKPLLNKGYTKLQVTAVVFSVSAFFHEYLVSVPLKMFGYWAFFGMLFQIPFAIFVSKFLKGQAANTAVWISLIIGQPLCILACYHDYYVIHHAIY